MGVPASKRVPYIELYRNKTMELRIAVTEGLLIKFGIKVKEQKIPKNFDIWSKEQQEKFLISRQKQYETQCGQTTIFMDGESEALYGYLRELFSMIDDLESLSPYRSNKEYEEMLGLFNQIISICNKIGHELFFIFKFTSVNANKFTRYSLLLHEEKELVSKWRKSVKGKRKRFLRHSRVASDF